MYAGIGEDTPVAEVNRTEYSARNAAVGMAAKVLCILFGYATRIVFVRMFASDLVGVNGLLHNALFAFALPMLGIDTALVYAMYAPVSRGDVPRQQALLRLYRRVYLVFAAGIAAAGAALYPFLPMLIGRSVEGLGGIYALFLAAVVCSYLWAAPGLVFLVYQRNYVNEILIAVGLLAQNVLQIAVLLLTRNYYLFLAMNGACTLARNLWISRKCRREYPKLFPAEAPRLPKADRQGILRDIRAMLVHKIGMVIINSTDNLILTAMFSLTAVARYANYYLILGSAEEVLHRGIAGITASVGNVGVTEDSAFVGRIFRVSVFAAFWVYATAVSVLFAVLRGFITLSFGADYVLPQSLTAVICLNLYLNGIRNATLVFRDALGLFRYDRWKTVVEALVNLGVSILLARWLGMVGVFLGTTVSIVLISIWVEPLILYKKYLKTPVLPYFTRFLAYLVSAVAAAALTWFLCRSMPEGALGLLLSLPICLTAPTALLLLLWHRSEEFRVLWGIALPYLKRPVTRLRGGAAKDGEEAGRDG